MACPTAAGRPRFEGFTWHLSVDNEWQRGKPASAWAVWNTKHPDTMADDIFSQTLHASYSLTVTHSPIPEWSNKEHALACQDKKHGNPHKAAGRQGPGWWRQPRAAPPSRCGTHISRTNAQICAPRTCLHFLFNTPRFHPPPPLPSSPVPSHSVDLSTQVPICGLQHHHTSNEQSRVGRQRAIPNVQGLSWNHASQRQKPQPSIS